MSGCALKEGSIAIMCKNEKKFIREKSHEKVPQVEKIDVMHSVVFLWTWRRNWSVTEVT